MIEYNINGKIIKFKPHQFEGKKSKEFYEQQIINSLNKIGITKEHIQITYSNNDEQSFAQVEWKINNKQFIFRCDSQEKTYQNLGAIAQAIQEDIRQITRGIKDLFTIMNQYETKIKTVKKKSLLDYHNPENSNKTFTTKDIKSNKEINEELDPKYNYLTKYSNEKLDLFYLKFKEECVRNNSINHPLLKALKIIRQKRGLKL